MGICRRYIEINVISREFYIGVYGEGTENINVITRENVIWRYVISGFHCSENTKTYILYVDKIER
jgi:hypothetical protein